MNLDSQSNISQNEEEKTESEDKGLDDQKRESQSQEINQRGKEAFELFLKGLEEKKSTEDKLSFAIDQMRVSLAQFGEPDFKGFWEARRLCLPFFKENINPIVRMKLWNDFINLSQEARKLKDILDEEATFAKEQLDIAIKALETDINDYENKIKQIADAEFPLDCQFLKDKYEIYNERQRELNLLNTFAARINSLRKEIIKIGMRLRYKSKFLKSLSICGDKIFPKRKELIKEVSAMFIQDVLAFVEKYFGNEKEKVPFYLLKNEIKALQNTAKILTLSTKCFTETRLKLSQCWDKIKIIENQKKEELSEKRKDLKENFENILKKIGELEEKCKGEILTREAINLGEEIQKDIGASELMRLDVKQLKIKLQNALKPIAEKERIEKEREQKRKEEEQQNKNEAIENSLNKIENLIKNEEKYSFEEMSKEKEELLKIVGELSLNKMEKQNIEKALKPLKDIIIGKKEKALLNLSKDQIQALDQMKEVLNQRVERRNEIKKQLEKYRKDLGSSGLDFEKAMVYREMMDMEKERLDKINELIEEVEIKIAEIEGD
jgi:hypothetical protein